MELFAQGRSGTLRILRDEPEQSSNYLESPVTRLANTTAARGQSIGGGRDAGLGTPTSAFGRGRRNVCGYTSATLGPMGRENTPIGSARRGSSVLPAWYPRTPLRDITAVVRAIERRSARLREVEGLQMDRPMSQDPEVVDSPKPLSGAQLEHNAPVLSPNPTFPKSTPSARKAEREKKVRTLMSMR